MKICFKLGLFVGFILSHLASGETLQIAADISLKGVLTELSEVYQENVSTNTLQLNFAPSGVLRKQMDQENWNLVIMASKGEIEVLKEAGKIEPETIKRLAKNRLVVVSSWPAKIQKNWIEIADTQWRRIVVANPETTMSGVAAQMVLQAEGFLESWTGKVFYENNSEKVVDWVKRAKADAGFLYQSDLVFLKPKETFTIFEVNEMLYSPIEYYAALTQKNPSRKEMENFLSWLAQENNKPIWKAWEFAVP